MVSGDRFKFPVELGRGETLSLIFVLYKHNIETDYSVSYFPLIGYLALQCLLSFTKFCYLLIPNINLSGFSVKTQ